MKQSNTLENDRRCFKLVDDNEDDGLGVDILAWWKMKASKYHVISLMARDILVILMSTVSFESAFSTKG